MTFEAYKPLTAEFTFFSSEKETFTKIYHILGHMQASTNFRGPNSCNILITMN